MERRQPDLDTTGVVWELPLPPGADPLRVTTRLLTIPQLPGGEPRYLALRAGLDEGAEPRLRPKVLSRPLTEGSWRPRALTGAERAEIGPGVSTLLGFEPSPRPARRGDVLVLRSPRAQAFLLWDPERSLGRALNHRLHDERRPGEQLLAHPQPLGVPTPATMSVSEELRPLPAGLTRVGLLSEEDLSALPEPTAPEPSPVMVGTWVLEPTSGRVAPSLVWANDSSGVTLLPGRVDRGRDRALDELPLEPSDVIGTDRALSVFNRAPRLLTHDQARRALRRTVGHLTESGLERVRAHLLNPRLPSLDATLPRGVVLDVLNHHGHLTPELLWCEIGGDRLVTLSLFASERPGTVALGELADDGHDGPVWLASRLHRLERDSAVAVRGMLRSADLEQVQDLVVEALDPRPGSVLWAPVEFENDEHVKVRPLVVTQANGAVVSALVGSATSRPTSHFARTSVELADWSQRVTWVRATRVELDLRRAVFSSDGTHLSSRDTEAVLELAARTEQLGLRATVPDAP